MRKVKVPILIMLALFALTACGPSTATPPPTLVRLDRSELEQDQAGVAAAPMPTPIPFPSPTPTPTPFALDPPLTPTPANPSTQAPVAPLVEVIATALNLRQGPDLAYSSLGAAVKNDQFQVVGIDASGNWLQIVTGDGNLAWISAQPTYTRLLAATLTELPVVEFQPETLTSLSQSASAPVAPPAASHAQTAAKNVAGRLVFMTGSGGNLYVINADGSDLRLLAGGVIDPVLSPDGQQVAFTRWDGAENGTLYTVNIDGSGERAILGEVLQAKSPTWSPDGQQIVLSFQHGGLRDPKEECRTFDFDDGIRIPKNVQITRVDIGEREITICFIRNEDLQWGLRQVDVATGAFEDLPADLYSYNPAWDPKNPWRVIYDGNNGLVQLDVTNGSLWPITTDLRDTGPVFSPSGQRLALTYKQHDHWEVYTLDLETGQRRRLTKPPLLAEPQYNSAAPTWSPDGSQLAFVTDRTGRWEIWVMNADGSHPRPLFSAELQAQLGLVYRGVNERMLNWTE